MKELQRWPCRKDSSSMEPGAGLASGSAHARMQSETMQKAWRRRARSARNAKCRHHACVSGDPGEPHIAAAPRNGRAPTAHRRPRECETREVRARLCRFPGSIDTHHVSLAPPPHPTPSLALAPPHRPEIVLTQAGILGLRSRLARSGPGGEDSDSGQNRTSVRKESARARVRIPGRPAVVPAGRRKATAVCMIMHRQAMAQRPRNI
jgi:hypothetical protein